MGSRHWIFKALNVAVFSGQHGLLEERLWLKRAAAPEKYGLLAIICIATRVCAAIGSLPATLQTGRARCAPASFFAASLHMKRLTNFCIALLFVSMAGMALGAETLYKTVGPDGKVDYSDKPPPDGKVEKTMQFNNLPSSEVPGLSLSYVEQLRRFKASQAKTPATPAAGVVLYAASWCGYCRHARSYLAKKSIPYQEIDIDTPRGKESFAEIAGGGGIPVLFASGQRVQGYSVPAYDALFANWKQPAKPAKP